MNIVVLSGAGMSAESGISTFRDQNGLWENHDIMDVASIEGWHKNPALVLDFYNKRRAQLFEVHPNSAHLKIASWQENHHVVVVTQNVDDLHERAGSTNVIHLHGTLRSVRSQFNSTLNSYL
jgi:NAD-dependent deacetylase